jgi:hypothetical protein
MILFYLFPVHFVFLNSIGYCDLRLPAVFLALISCLRPGVLTLDTCPTQILDSKGYSFSMR